MVSTGVDVLKHLSNQSHQAGQQQGAHDHQKGQQLGVHNHQQDQRLLDILANQQQQPTKGE